MMIYVYLLTQDVAAFSQRFLMSRRLRISDSPVAAARPSGS